MTLTAKQHACLSFLEGYFGELGYSPSYREIATALGLRSTSVVSSLLDKLAARGYLTHRAAKARSIVLVSLAPKEKRRASA